LPEAPLPKLFRRNDVVSRLKKPQLANENVCRYEVIVKYGIPEHTNIWQDTVVGKDHRRRSR